MASRRWARSPMKAVAVAPALALGIAACASLHNTSAQDLAYSRWRTCEAQVSGLQIDRIDPDGRIRFWYLGTWDMNHVVECLQVAGQSGSPLPEPVGTLVPRGT